MTAPARLPTMVSIVWIDENRAKLFRITDDLMERQTIHATDLPDTPAPEAERMTPARISFYDAVAEKLKGARRIVILGPSGPSAPSDRKAPPRTEFLHHLEDRHPSLFGQVVDCQPSEQSSDQQIANFALSYLRVVQKELA